MSSQMSNLVTRSPYTVLHISASCYEPGDRSHSTYAIWQRLQEGFSRYHIFARSTGKSAHIFDDQLHIHLIRSLKRREFEALFTQFLFLPLGLRLSPDAVVSQHPVLGGLVGYLLSKMLKIPHLVELHGVELSSAGTGGFKHRVTRFIAGFVYRSADRIRVLSEKMAADLIDSFPKLPAFRIYVLPPRVDLDTFRPKTDWSRSERLRVIMAGTLIERKGQLRAIETLATSGMQIELLLAGDGPDLAQCRARARDLEGGALKVTLLGRLTPIELAECLREADVFLMNSISEGTPRAIMEAMALALPVITTDAGYCNEIVEHGRTGFVIPRHGGESELVRNLEQLAGNEELRRDYGLAGLQRTRDKYESNRNFARYRELICQMIQESIKCREGGAR